MGGSRSIVAALVIVALAASGCAGSVDCRVEQGSTGQKTICNGSVFTYTYQGAPQNSADTYTWENNRGIALVSAVFQGSGSASVTVKDAAGKQVYARQHSSAGQTAESTTAAGAKGPWTITIQVSSLSGQLVVTVTPKAG